MRIFAFPFKDIAYLDSLYAEIKAQGVEVLRGEWAGRWMLENLRRDDVIHIHWPSFMYEAHGAKIIILRSFLRFLLFLALARIKAADIWWTAHNLMPHERCAWPIIDVLARHAVIKAAGRIFVHGAEAQKLLVKRFPAVEKKCVQIPHGNWIDRYPSCASRETVRAELKLPQNAFTYLFFGQCKQYKNLDTLIKIFLIEASAEDFLLVAGRFSDAAYFAEILELAGGDPRIKIDARFIPDAELSMYLKASDAMCMPYREILTSGTTMLAFSFGIPVLSIDRGFLRDVVTEDTGVLIEPDNERALAAGLRELRQRQWSSDSIIRQAKRFTFKEAAETMLSCLPGGKAYREQYTH